MATLVIDVAEGVVYDTDNFELPRVEEGDFQGHVIPVKALNENRLQLALAKEYTAHDSVNVEEILARVEQVAVPREAVEEPKKRGGRAAKIEPKEEPKAEAPKDETPADEGAAEAGGEDTTSASGESESDKGKSSEGED